MVGDYTASVILQSYISTYTMDGEISANPPNGCFSGKVIETIGFQQSQQGMCLTPCFECS